MDRVRVCTHGFGARARVSTRRMTPQFRCMQNWVFADHVKVYFWCVCVRVFDMCVHSQKVFPREIVAVPKGPVCADSIRYTKYTYTYFTYAGWHNNTSATMCTHTHTHSTTKLRPKPPRTEQSFHIKHSAQMQQHSNAWRHYMVNLIKTIHQNAEPVSPVSAS